VLTPAPALPRPAAGLKRDVVQMKRERNEAWASLKATEQAAAKAREDALAEVQALYDRVGELTAQLEELRAQRDGSTRARSRDHEQAVRGRLAPPQPRRQLGRPAAPCCTPGRSQPALPPTPAKAHRHALPLSLALDPSPGPQPSPQPSPSPNLAAHPLGPRCRWSGCRTA
jgi:hypothetical protein